ncbi:stalk domain-containing protein [Paenibacillus sp. FJAT-26967]|uniref:stalk domain-containing protein n=1 Tax=Paenibacillus sp. FJAT-26967 TaxID=1729690 RepID=UPI0008381CCE|nr:stalk domain-containing protein [Paenibacillus sp. FJAT-26967]
MYISKKAFVSSIVASSLLFGSMGVFAAGGIEKIQAYLNHDIKFQVNGKSWVPKDSDGVKLAPVVYEGSSYLPARAVAEALGAEVKWDDDTQTIYIKSGSGSSTDGIPYKDGAGNSSGSSTTTPSNPGGSGSVSVPASGGADRLPGDFDPDKSASDLQTQAVALIKLYGEALKTSDMSKFNAYVDGNVADKNGNKYMPGREYSKKLFKDNVAKVQKANDATTIANYGTALTSVSSSDVKIPFKPSKLEVANFSYKFSPKDWDSFSATTVNFEYTKTDSGDYVLRSVSVR